MPRFSPVKAEKVAVCFGVRLEVGLGQVKAPMLTDEQAESDECRQAKNAANAQDGATRFEQLSILNE